MHVIPAFNRAHHAIEAALAAAGQHHHRHQQRHKTEEDYQKAPHWVPSFLTLSLSLSLSFSLYFPCGAACTPPNGPSAPPSPPMLPKFPKSSILTGPRISTIVSSFGATSRMNMPCVSPFTSLTITSVVSPVFFSCSRTIGDHSVVSKYWRSFSMSSIEYWTSLSNSYSRT